MKQIVFSVIHFIFILFIFACSKDNDSEYYTDYDKRNETSDNSSLIIGFEINDLSFDKPTVVMANDDSEATSHDNLYIGYSSIVQLQPELYYMYYICKGNSSFISNDDIQELAFAYSTDGIHWIREIPNGIEEPVPGTNLIFDWRKYKAMVIEQDIVKVMDTEYPFRMIGSKGPSSNPFTQTIYMWKSKDGIHFEQEREILKEMHDTQVSIIVRGNVLKVYLRMREDGSNTTRQIGVMYIDLDGNILSPPTTLFGGGYYQAAASIIDDRRELLLPTFFDEKNDKNWYDAFIVEGTKITHINTNINDALLNPEKDGRGNICPKIITIGYDQYIYYVQRNSSHARVLIGNETKKKYEIRMSKITWNTKGKPYK